MPLNLFSKSLLISFIAIFSQLLSLGSIEIDDLSDVQNKQILALIDQFSLKLNNDLASPLTPTFYHILSEIKENGTKLTLSDGSIWEVNKPHNEACKKWKAGNRLKIYLDKENIKIENVDQLEIAWGSFFHFPGQKEKITISRLSPPATVELSNGLILRSELPEMGMKHNVGDHVFIFHWDLDLYFLFNFAKEDALLCSMVTNVPMAEPESLSQSESEYTIPNILELKEKLNVRVLQQEDASEAIYLSLLSYVAGLKPKEKPIGIFLFLGPTGVGKTELAKSLAEELFGSRNNLTRFDMSHFSTPHTVDRLIGSPPGYVNHEEGGQLSEAILAKPHSIVLLDEMEKAHANVHKFFLPVFDEGFFLDNKNHAIDCSNIIFIMTSNLCGEEIAELFNLGYSPEEILESIEGDLMDELSPELYNRVEPVLFRPLEQETMHGLIDLLLNQLIEQVKKDKNIEVSFDESAKKYLFENGFHPTLGARPMRKLIEKKIVSLLALNIVKEEIVAGDRVVIKYSSAKDLFTLKKLD